MKRQVIVTILIVCLMNIFMAGCGTQQAPTDVKPVLRSSDYTFETVQMDALGEGAQPQAISLYLADSTYIEAAKTYISSEFVEIQLNVIYPDQSIATRKILIGNSLKTISIKDAAGDMIAGYAFDSAPGDNCRLSIFNINTALAIETGYDTNSPIELSINTETGAQIVEFINEFEFYQAFDIYDAVQGGRILLANLSEYETALYTKVDNYIVLSAVFQTDDNLRDIDLVAELTSNPEMNNWLGYLCNDPNTPILTIPRWLDLVCKIIKIGKMICHLVGDSEICEWLDVADETCEAIREILR